MCVVGDVEGSGFGALLHVSCYQNVARFVRFKLKCSQQITDTLVITFRKVSLSRPTDDIPRNQFKWRSLLFLLENQKRRSFCMADSV